MLKTFDFLVNNRTRVLHVVKEAIKDFALNLTDLVIYTEAATGYPGYTPIIAAMARAKKVFAITKDSKYGSKEKVLDITYDLANAVGVEDKIKVVFDYDSDDIAQAGIITNTGFVRPIDRWMIESMKETAVVPLMFEAWEHRQEDVDLVACNENNIMVMGTDERDERLRMFEYLPYLCLKQLLNHDIEICDSKIVVVGEGVHFNHIISSRLMPLATCYQMNVFATSLVNKKLQEPYLKNVDAIIIADDKPRRLHIGEKGDITAKELKTLSPYITVLQLKGRIDRKDLDKYDIPYMPKEDRGAKHMGFTLNDLGPKPSIRLTVAGLKVGEAMARARLEGKNIGEAKEAALANSPAQDFA